MGDDNLHVLTFYVYLLKNEINKIIYNGRKQGEIIELSKLDNYYYGINDLSGKGHALYVDSYGFDSKPIQKNVKFEIRTYKKADGANWTTVYTYPL